MADAFESWARAVSTDTGVRSYRCSNPRLRPVGGMWVRSVGFKLFRGRVSSDTVNEVTIMVDATSNADHKEASSSARFRKLPERIRPEDMIATQETEWPCPRFVDTGYAAS